MSYSIPQLIGMALLTLACCKVVYQIWKYNSFNIGLRAGRKTFKAGVIFYVAAQYYDLSKNVLTWMNAAETTAETSLAVSAWNFGIIMLAAGYLFLVKSYRLLIRLTTEEK